jgi:signal transduction histidine kinase
LFLETSDEYKHQTGSTPFRLHRLYTTALIVLALLLTISQIATQYRLYSIQKRVQVIRYASLQRHQSQQLVSKTLQLGQTTQPAQFQTIRSELKQLFTLFESTYEQSQEGYLFENSFRVSNSSAVNRLYADVKPYYDTLSRSTRTLISFQSPAQFQSPVGALALRQFLRTQGPFLQKVDGVVQQYNSEIRSQLDGLQWLEFAFYTATLGLVLLLSFWVFRPAIHHLKQTMDQLILAENTTAEANRKLVRLNRSLHEARQRLFQATKQQHQQEMGEQKLRASSLIAGQEEERKRLSRELHDGLGQMLTGIKLQVEGLETHLNRSFVNEDPLTHKRIQALKDLISQTISETRSISNDLMPSVLSDFGVIPALKLLTETAAINQSSKAGLGPDIQFETNLPTTRLDRQVEISLYRITQEAVTNAIRHGKPSQINIELIERENYLHLVVTDNGNGFSIQRLREPYGSSQGIHNMQERTKLLNGRFKIRSAPGKGTKLYVSIPYQVQYSAYEHDTINAR